MFSWLLHCLHVTVTIIIQSPITKYKTSICHPKTGRLKEELISLLWNGLPGYNFVLVVFFVCIIVIYCHLSLLCLKMALDGLKLVAAINILQSRKLFEIRFCASIYLLNYQIFEIHIIKIHSSKCT